MTAKKRSWADEFTYLDDDDLAIIEDLAPEIEEAEQLERNQEMNDLIRGRVHPQPEEEEQSEEESEEED